MVRAEFAALCLDAAATLTVLCNRDTEDVWLERGAPYMVGSKDLLDAVQGPCQERGIRCTDVDGTAQLLLFERV